jgi:hypothetical protein
MTQFSLDIMALSIIQCAPEIRALSMIAPDLTGDFFLAFLKVSKLVSAQHRSGAESGYVTQFDLDLQ